MELVLKALYSNAPNYFLILIAISMGWYVIKQLEGIIRKLEAKIEKLEEKIEAMSTDFVTKEQHYRDISGWRGEIHKLEDKLERNIERLLEKIIEITKMMGGAK